jgi:hypothetical protein
MAYSSGILGANAFGNLIAILDAKLLENAHWSIYDAAAGVDAEILTNGNFAAGNTDWSVAANWSTATGAAVHTPGSAGALAQSIASLANHIYWYIDVTFTASVSASNVVLTVTNGTLVSITGGTATIAASGTYTARFYINHVSNTPVLTFTPNTLFDGSIDDVAGTVVTSNCKVYRCYDATENCDFYMWVDDAHPGFSVIQLWEGWNAGTHVGVGASLAAAGTSAHLKINYAPGGWGISVRDHCFTWQDYVGDGGAFVGQPDRYDTSKNIVVFCGPGHTATTNSLGAPATSSEAAWSTLFDENGNKVNLSFIGMSGATSRVKTIGGEVILRENQLVNQTSFLVLGKMPGVASYGGSASGIITGDTVVIGGVTWRACYSTYLSFVELA